VVVNTPSRPEGAVACQSEHRCQGSPRQIRSGLPSPLKSPVAEAAPKSPVRLTGALNEPSPLPSRIATVENREAANGQVQFAIAIEIGYNYIGLSGSKEFATPTAFETCCRHCPGVSTSLLPLLAITRSEMLSPLNVHRHADGNLPARYGRDCSGAVAIPQHDRYIGELIGGDDK